MTKLLTIDEFTAKLSGDVKFNAGTYLVVDIRFSGARVGTVRFDDTESGWQYDSDSASDVEYLLSNYDCTADLAMTDICDAIGEVAEIEADGVEA